MEIKVINKTIESIYDEAVAVGIFEDAKKLTSMALMVDKLTGGIIKEVIDYGDFSGKLNRTLMLYVKKGLRIKRLLLIGLGKEKDFNPDRLRGAVSIAVCYARDTGLKSFVIPFALPDKGHAPQSRVRAFVEGVILGLYKFCEFKSKKKDDKKDRLDSVTILVSSPEELKEAGREVKHAETIARAVCAARDLVSQPGNNATPVFLADTARAIAKKEGLSFKALNEKNAGKLGMGAFLGVAKGSDQPARFIILEYKPGINKFPTVVLVGKAITFDSGGISLKSPNKMNEMKTDMAGGAAVLGVLQAVAGLKLKINVVGLVPATENMPNGRALKPGDIVKSMSGKTVEIISTDAEGRLIMCDALTYADRYKPEAIIDIATLTGACIIALGNDISAVMGNDDRLIEDLRSAGEATGEKVWQLPLWEEYKELIKSDIADLKNAGGPSAGSITAGYFLKEFAGNTPWAHLDIAGTAWTDKNKPYIPKGATGVGVRLIVELLEKLQGRAREQCYSGK